MNQLYGWLYGWLWFFLHWLHACICFDLICGKVIVICGCGDYSRKKGGGY